MKRYSKITPEGTRDLLFEECDARRKVEVTLSTLYKQCRYSKVMTPAIEFYDVFDRESAGFPLESLYKLTDLHGRLIVMRPDNTMPIARIVATRLKNVVYPLRLYYTQSVYLQSPSFAGHNDEIAQSGIELIGAGGIRADLEVIHMAIDALNLCGAPDFCIELGHAGFFKAISDKLDVDKDIKDDIAKLIESKNYAALNDLLDEIGDAQETRAIKALPKLFGGEEVLAQAAEIYSGEEANEALSYLRQIYHCLTSLGLEGKIRIDLGIVNRINYYTGIVFRGYIEGSGITVLSGGRYDHLIHEFGVEDTPAIGFAVEVDALTSAMVQRGDIRSPKPAQRLVFGLDGCEMRAIIHRKELYNLGIDSEICVAQSLEEAKACAAEKNIKILDIVDSHSIKTLEL